MDILLVDANSRDQKLIKHLLSSGDNPYKWHSVVSLHAALDIVQTRHIELVLFDYALAKNDVNLEIIRSLRTQSQSSKIALIVTTHEFDDGTAEDYLRAGAQDFVLKEDISPAIIHRAVIQADIRYCLENEIWNSYEKVKQLAESDSLTGLANRHMFDENLKVTISHSRRRGEKFALLLIDLDHFKQINDKYGHHIGDTLLKKAVNRVRGCLRGDELFGRVGGDEFAIILDDIDDPQNASRVASRILHVFIKPFEVGKVVVNASVSIGIVMYPDDGDRSETLTECADIAMYRAKKMGRNTVCFYQDNMQKQFSERFLLEHQLHYALEQKQFELYFQPTINLETKTLYGAETLIRWTFDGEARAPDSFIPIAEESRKIVGIGHWVISESFRRFSTWLSSEKATDFTLFINLSSIQIHDKELPLFVEEQIHIHNILPHQIAFDITERSLSSSALEESQVLPSLKELGCQLILDDFGSDTGAVNNLIHWPFDTVKIHPSWLPKGSAEKDKIRALQGITNVIHAQKLHVIIEGVETAWQAKLCEEINIQLQQGRWHSPPITHEALMTKFCCAND